MQELATCQLHIPENFSNKYQKQPPSFEFYFEIMTRLLQYVAVVLATHNAHALASWKLILSGTIRPPADNYPEANNQF